jgi:Fe-S cluster biogenesis protein NfuA
MATPIELTAEPVDEIRCKFILSRPVEKPGVTVYTAQQDAADSPVAQAVLGISGIEQVIVSGNVLTVVKSDPDLPWTVLEPHVRYAVNTAVATQEESPTPGLEPADDDAIYGLVEEIFRTTVNPAVAQHGGKIELIDVQDATVIVRLMGGCHGCGMAAVTLRQGVEAALRRAIPGLKGVRDVTDHGSGANPYYAPDAS